MDVNVRSRDFETAYADGRGCGLAEADAFHFAARQVVRRGLHIMGHLPVAQGDSFACSRCGATGELHVERPVVTFTGAIAGLCEG